MNQTRRNPAIIGLCILLLLVFSGCSDDTTLKPSSNPETKHDASSQEPKKDTDSNTTDAPDANDEHDVRTNSELQVHGQFVPTAGRSTNTSFTLSGHLSPGTPQKTSSNSSFSLKLKPGH